MTDIVALSRIIHHSIQFKSNCIVFQMFPTDLHRISIKTEFELNCEEFTGLGDVSCEEVYEIRQQYLILSYLEDNIFSVFSNCDAIEN